MKTPTILLAAALAAACTTQNNSALVITSVLPPTLVTDTSTTTPPVTTSHCDADDAGKEASFLPVNLAENQGNVFATVVSAILPTNSANSLNGDASFFLPHQAVITYQFLTADGNPPAGVTVVHPVIVPLDGLPVPGGGSASILVTIFPEGAITGPVPDGTFIRATFHIEGKLLGETTAHTSERDYLFEICTAAGCAQNTCL